MAYAHTGFRERLLKKFRQGSSGVLMAYLHVHKAMGSSFCQLARANIPSNRMPYDIVACRASWSQAALTDSSVARKLICPYSELNRIRVHDLPRRYHGLSFISAEGAMPTTIPERAPVIFVTTLRHPLRRLISSYLWWREQPWARKPDVVCHGYLHDTPLRNLPAVAWLGHVPDNFMARSLCGLQYLARDGAQYQISEMGLSRCAIKRLATFAAVTIVEYPKESARLLAARFGWANFGDIFREKGKRTNEWSTAQLPHRFKNATLHQIAWLEAHGNATLAADYRLYARAVTQLLKFSFVRPGRTLASDVWMTRSM